MKMAFDIKQGLTQYDLGQPLWYNHAPFYSLECVGRFYASSWLFVEEISIVLSTAKRHL